MRFTKDVFNFLSTYQPKQLMFTSDEEYNLVEEILDIKSKTLDEINEMRNDIVLFYTEMMKEFNDIHTKISIVSSMQSITHVIDNKINKR